MIRFKKLMAGLTIAVTALTGAAAIDAPEADAAFKRVCGGSWCIDYQDGKDGCHYYAANNSSTGVELIRVICGGGDDQYDTGWH